MNPFADLGDVVKVNEPLAPYTFLRLGGPAEFLIQPRSRDELALVVRTCSQNKIPMRILGGGCMVLVRDEGVKGALLGPVDRTDLFGPPAFRFEDVEVIGFRVDLGAYGRDFTPELERLVEPLNFHLKDSPIWDFRYRAATPILLIELLRYGRMRLKSPSPPLVPQDYQSQHELVVRLLVGKVDDDAAQAHDPATYVPAIFVDNPWSKVVGRDVQGFDKRMASFCVPGRGGPVAVLPDGCMHGQRGAARTPRPTRDSDSAARSTLEASMTGRGSSRRPSRPRTITTARIVPPPSAAPAATAPASLRASRRSAW